MTSQPSMAVQDYLKAIHRLGGADQMVTTADIAARLSIRPPSVTGMLKRLHEEKWIDYESGKGGKLTAKGLREARRVVRRHRLVELFLHKVLGLDWSEIDAEAEALEHAISPRLEQAIATFLGEPLEDPHGHPIPTQEGKLANRHLISLASLQMGDQITIREVTDENPDRLRRWKDLDMVPGAVVKLTGHQPLDDVFELEVNGRLIRMGSEGLAGLTGEKVS